MGRKLFAVSTAILACCLTLMPAGAADIPPAGDLQPHGQQAAAKRIPMPRMFTPDSEPAGMALPDYFYGAYPERAIDRALARVRGGGERVSLASP